MNMMQKAMEFILSFLFYSLITSSIFLLCLHMVAEMHFAELEEVADSEGGQSGSRRILMHSGWPYKNILVPGEFYAAITTTPVGDSQVGSGLRLAARATEDEEDQLVQMVKQFIESSSPSNNTFYSPRRHNLHPPNYVALSDMVESETELEAELLEHVLRHMRKMDNGHVTESSCGKRWLVKKLKMDGYRASLCHSSWVSSLSCPGGDYEYVDVMVRNDKKSSSSSPLTRLIIDVDFKSQFQLARPTDAYRQLVEILPSVFVGDERKLEGIVSLICSAAKQSLVDRGLHVPPWRTAVYMLSKWRRSPTTSTVSSSDVDADYS